MESTSKAKAKPKAGINSLFILISFSLVSRCCFVSRFSSSAVTTSALNPRLSIVSRILRLLITSGSKTATPVSLARFTCMDRTPSSPPTTFSILAEQAAQVIPVIARSRVTSLLGISSSKPRPATFFAISSSGSTVSSHSISMVSAARFTETE